MTPLHFAAGGGHAAVVEALLQAGADVEAAMATEEQARPLHLAAAGGHADVIRALLKAGACVDALQSDSGTALHLVARNGHLEAAKVLLEAGADKEAQTENNYLTAAAGWRPIHFAARQGHAALIKDQNTPLTLAARNGHLEAVRVLLEAGVDRNTSGEADKTARQWAWERGHMEVVRLLQKDNKRGFGMWTVKRSTGGEK
ncbi:hypothetical protein HYH03_009102 [Edaphochlamys debaryana]|uniref:Uncharacterized protein n=1 Tax=Edaphochlamys debaryana TaxID=47281 RepID=A0A836BYU7_9CHLO|nr:hypothetical protein HYH03_009102 [Edaphochlamys debaryana]|eukprot:KAG2492688.1 hypothetical protein HYH03_009102 [Edaphochlamys debaryana]